MHERSIVPPTGVHAAPFEDHTGPKKLSQKAEYVSTGRSVRVRVGYCHDLSPSWRRRTQATLKLGNTINRGHKALDGAVGVTISSLLKLANTKATDGTTLLDYIVRFVAERGEADLLQVRAELPSLEVACGLDEPTLVVEARCRFRRRGRHCCRCRCRRCHRLARGGGARVSPRARRRIIIVAQRRSTVSQRKAIFG